MAGLRERKKNRTRAMLIDAAIELSQRQGFDRTTVDQIAALADVSPRTFSRYFTTKEAVILALADEITEAMAAQVLRQPPGLSELDALRAGYIEMIKETKSAPPDGLTTERMMTTAQIVHSSTDLLTSSANRRQAMTGALAARMGVGVDDRRVDLAIAVWSAIALVAVADFGPDTDWQAITIDMIVARIDETFAQFGGLIARVGQPVAPLHQETGNSSSDAGFGNNS